MRWDEDAGIGERIAYHRKRRGLSQVVMAGLLGKSEEWLSQIERGSRDLERLSTIAEVAKVLRIEPLRLLGKPFVSTPRTAGDGTRLGTAPDYVPLIRQAMRRYDGMARFVHGAPATRPSLTALRRDVERAFYCSQTERWSELGPMLPGMIADAYDAVQTYEGDELRRAYGLQALVYRVTSGMLDRIGETDLPYLAAERSLAAADMTEDPLLVAGGAWRLAVVLRHAGQLVESGDVPMAAADALRPGLADAGPETHSVYGSLLLKGAVAAASLGDGLTVRDCMAEAGRAAVRTGDSRNDYWFAFGQTNVAIHAVWLAVEMDDPSEALARADAVDARRVPPALSERVASHHIAVAWANYLRRKDRESIEALRSARIAAPEQLLFTRKVQSMVRGMLRRERRSIKSDLREMADFIGVG